MALPLAGVSYIERSDDRSYAKQGSVIAGADEWLIHFIRMNWLKDHVYVAAWVSPLLALIGMFIQNSTSYSKHLDASRIMIYVAFLTAIAVVFTPIIDNDARVFAGFFLVPLTGFIIWDAATKGGHTKLGLSRNPVVGCFELFVCQAKIETL